MNNIAYIEDDPDATKSNFNNKSLIQDDEVDLASKKWYLFTRAEKTIFIFYTILKVLMFIALLFLFLLSLKFMSIGFTLVSSYALKASDAIKFILSNPFAALSIGIVVTAIMQNSTATTSIAVSMVGAGIIPSVKIAIPIIMGSNIGTCATNSFIALTLSGDPSEFKRAFSAATLNDIFNFLTVLILLPLEIFTNFLFNLSYKITNLIPFENANTIAKADFLSHILNPAANLFIQLNSTAVNELSKGNKDITEVALRCCGNNFNLNTSYDILNKTKCIECDYLCVPMLRSFGDGGTGLFWIIFSLIVLIACLFGIVKVLSLIIVGPIARGINQAVNASFPGKFKWVTQIVLFFIAFLLTLVVQSSNIITATLVPLCGIGIVTLQRVYVMTLGSNIGTTVTGILSAFAQPQSSLKKAMQLAFVYTLFNIFGVILWLPIPYLRFPKTYARKLGNIVFQYRWFLYVYVTMVYFVLPLIVFALALVPMWIGLAIFGIPMIKLFLGFGVVKVLRKLCPSILPEKLKNFDWLPIWLRSLEFYDEKIKKIGFKERKNKISKGSYLLGIEDKNLEEEQGTITNVIRRMSAIDSIVREARIYSRKNTIFSSEDDCEEEMENDCINRSSYSKIVNKSQEDLNKY